MPTPEFSPLTGKSKLAVQRATARMNMWDGAVRSSKTIGSILAWMKFVREAPPGELLMVGKTRDTIQRNVISVMQRMVGRQAKFNRGTGELTLFGRLVYVVGANDERSGDKIRGMTLAGTYCDELTILPESFFKMLMTRLSVDGSKMFGTTNPDNPRHWLKKDYLDRARGHLTRDGRWIERADGLDLHRFTFQLADNPHLSAEYLANLELEYTGLWHKRFILGEWVIAEGAIYDMWDESRHVVPYRSLPRMERRITTGVDYGTRNPFAAVQVGLAVDPADGLKKLWCIDQYRWDSAAKRAQRTSAQYSADLHAFHAATGEPEWIYVDPSAAEFRNQLFTDGHKGVQAADNSVVDGIRTVASLLSADRLKVSDRCTGIIESIPGYAWDDRAAQKGEDKPIKLDDHDLDAKRYAVHSSAWTWRHALGMSDRIGADRNAA